MIKTKYPTTKPSLNLDFANTKSLDPRITFRRGTPGTYYDGVTHVKAEENLLSYSEKFDQSGTTFGLWDKTGLNLTTNSTDEFLSPNETQTAWKISDSTTTNINHGLFQQVYTTDSSQEIITTSIFAKAGDADRYLQILHGSDDTNYGFPFANFDLFNGTITRNEETLNASMTDAGNGWYRCSITFFTTTLSGKKINPVFYMVNSPNAERDEYYTGDGSSGFYLWGAQLEQRDTVTSYTATNGTPITKYQPKLMTASPDDARFDHDPITGESKGLLIEEKRENLIEYSEDFTQSFWNENRSGEKTSDHVFPNQLIAPDGVSSASKIVPTNASGVHYISSSHLNVSTNTVYTASCYFKAGEIDVVAIAFKKYNGSINWVNFNLTDVSATTAHTFDDYSIEDVGNDWRRCSVSLNLGEGADTNAGTLYFYVKQTSGWVGNNYDGVYMWGAQVEAGSFATSYIKSSGATAGTVRSADNASITGENFSSWYRQDQGSIITSASIDMNKRKGGAGMPVYNIMRDTTTLFALSRDSEYWYHFIINNNESTYKYASDSESVTGALTYDFSDGYLHSYVDQLENLSSTTWTWRVKPFIHEDANMLRLGTNNNGSNILNGHIKKISYYPQRLTNEQLQNLTK